MDRTISTADRVDGVPGFTYPSVRVRFSQRYRNIFLENFRFECEKGERRDAALGRGAPGTGGQLEIRLIEAW